jgi:hypothetical protein
MSIQSADVNNMASVRIALEDALKRGGEHEKELRALRHQLTEAQKTILRLTTENAVLNQQLREALKVANGG